MSHRIYHQESGHAILEDAVHTDGIYGEIGRELSTKDALAIGSTLGSMLKSKNQSLVIIGHDNRNTSEILVNETCRGLASSGCYVMRAGIAPSPALQFTAYYLEAACVVISAGSADSSINGFSISIEQKPLYGDRLRRFVALAANGSLSKERGGVIESNVLDAYMKKLKSRMYKKRKLKIAWDLCGGSACMVIPKISDEISGEHLMMNDELDSQFGGQLPSAMDPERQQIIQQVIQEELCDVGFIINADGRQLSVTDEKGQLWHTEDTFALLLTHIPTPKEGNRIAIVPVDCAMSLRQIAKVNNITLFYANRDAGNMLETMKEKNADLGFHPDGYFAFGKAYDFAPCNDGIFAAITMTNVLCQKTRKLSELRGSFHRDVRQPVRYFAHDNPEEVILSVRRRLFQQERKLFDLYGIRCDSDEGWWWLRSDGKYLALEISATSEATLTIINDEAEQTLALLSSEIAKPQEVAAETITPSVKTQTQKVGKALLNISEDDRETIDFTSRHWNSIKKPRIAKDQEGDEPPKAKRPWSRKGED